MAGEHRIRGAAGGIASSALLAFAWLLMLAPPATASPVVGAPPSSVNVNVGSHVGGSLSAFANDDDVYYKVESRKGTSQPEDVKYVAKFTGLSTSAGNVDVHALLRGPCNGSMALYDFDAGAWDNPSFFELSNEGESHVEQIRSAAFISDAGVAKVRITCEARQDNKRFVLKTDLLVAHTFG